MSLQELKNQAYKLSVSDRLELVSGIIESLSRELRPRKPLPKDFVKRLRGIAKTDAPPPTDAELE
ncbi:MAG: hypothetical protein AB4426_06715 [Xenococcaceae cyanobacterium]